MTDRKEIDRTNKRKARSIKLRKEKEGSNRSRRRKEEEKLETSVNARMNLQGVLTTAGEAIFPPRGAAIQAVAVT